MPMRLAAFVLLGLLGIAWTPAALAQTSSDATVEAPPSEPLPGSRVKVVLGVTGELDPEARSTLARLLRAELERHGLVLVELDPSGEARTWARHVTKDDAHLVAVLLDTKSRTALRLVVVDTARGRAISRELPGGERDAATVEAIVSIVVSASNALREGLEVASAPLETVVEPSKPPPVRPVPPKPPPKPEPSPGTTLHGSIAGIASSFSGAAEPMFGGTLAVGASIGSLVDVDLGAARYLPVTIDSAFGSFSLERTSLSLTLGLVFRSGSFAFVPALGATSEWIARTDTTAARGVARADEASAIHRLGGLLAMRGRYAVASSDGAELVSVVGSLGASYLGERVRFLAGSGALAEVRRSAFSAELGLFIATGSL